MKRYLFIILILLCGCSKNTENKIVEDPRAKYREEACQWQVVVREVALLAFDSGYACGKAGLDSKEYRDMLEDNFLKLEKVFDCDVREKEK